MYCRAVVPLVVLLCNGPVGLRIQRLEISQKSIIIQEDSLVTLSPFSKMQLSFNHEAMQPCR